jgi:hypothetical protein
MRGMRYAKYTIETSSRAALEIHFSRAHFGIFVRSRSFTDCALGVLFSREKRDLQGFNMFSANGNFIATV